MESTTIIAEQPKINHLRRSLAFVSVNVVLLQLLELSLLNSPNYYSLITKKKLLTSITLLLTAVVIVFYIAFTKQI